MGQRQRLRFGPLRWGKADDLRGLFFLSGSRMYEVGRMDGSFPRVGWHLPGEMGGVWAPPLKILDGFTWELEVAPGAGWRLEDACAFTHGFSYADFRFERESPPLRVRRWDFLVEEEAALFSLLTLQHSGSRPLKLRLRLWVDVHLRSGWGTSLAELESSEDVLSFHEGLLLAHKAGHRDRWGVALGAEIPPQDLSCERRRGKLEYEVSLEPGERQRVRGLIVAVDEGGPQEALRRFHTLLPRMETLFIEKRRACRKHVFEGVQFEGSDPSFREAFWCAKANLQMLSVQVPTLGRYPFAGVPEYVQLFGTDTAYAVPGLMGAGLWAVAREGLRRLAQAARAQGGRVPHEIALDGTVVHPGNAVETPQFVSACWEYVRWTADRAFLQEVYPVCRRGIGHLLERCDEDGAWYPEGEGMIERPGLGPKQLDVVCYLQKALVDLAEMAEALGREPQEASEPRRRAAELRRRLLHDWWLEGEALFADSLDAANTPKLAGHWTVAVPLEIGLVDGDRGRRMLRRLRQDWVNGWGLVHTRGSEERVWTLPTGVLTLAEFRYGSVERGLQLLRSIGETLQRGMLGAYSELIPEGGELMQLWSAAMMIRGLVEGLWGLRPRAQQDLVELAPKLPSGWTFMALRDLRLGDHTLTLTLRGEGLTLALHPSRRGEGERALRVQLPSQELVLFPGEEVRVALARDRGSAIHRR